MKNGKYAEIFLTLRGDRACKALSAGEVAAAVRLRWAGFGEGTPQQDLPKGQNRRYADFGTVVESCSHYSRYPRVLRFRISPSLPSTLGFENLPEIIENFLKKGIEKCHRLFENLWR